MPPPSSTAAGTLYITAEQDLNSQASAQTLVLYRKLERGDFQTVPATTKDDKGEYLLAEVFRLELTGIEMEGHFKDQAPQSQNPLDGFGSGGGGITPAPITNNPFPTTNDSNFVISALKVVFRAAFSQKESKWNTAVDVSLDLAELVLGKPTGNVNANNLVKQLGQLVLDHEQGHLDIEEMMARDKSAKIAEQFRLATPKIKQLQQVEIQLTRQQYEAMTPEMQTIAMGNAQNQLRSAVQNYINGMGFIVAKELSNLAANYDELTHENKLPNEAKQVATDKTIQQMWAHYPATN
jgi:hypothetical protein